jgi:hypothetical protein
MSDDPFADLPDLILLMHSFCTPAATIATRAHVPESVVKFVIAHGTLPDEELGPLWQRERRQREREPQQPAPQQPSPTRISDR